MTRRDELERALDEAVTALVRHRLAQPPHSGRLEYITMGELRAMTEAEAVAHDVARDPVGYRLRAEVKRIAHRLAPLLDWDKLHAMVERVASNNRVHYGQRLGLLCKVLDGAVMKGGDRWIA